MIIDCDSSRGSSIDNIYTLGLGSKLVVPMWLFIFSLVLWSVIFAAALLLFRVIHRSYFFDLIA